MGHCLMGTTRFVNRISGCDRAALHSSCPRVSGPFLADRLVMMTKGRAARIGEMIEIPFDRPRDRVQILEGPRYYDLRNRALELLYSGTHS
jgi:hypothetical protein